MVRQFDWLAGHLYPRAVRALHVVYAYRLTSRSLFFFLLLLVRVNFNRAVWYSCNYAPRLNWSIEQRGIKSDSILESTLISGKGTRTLENT